MAGNVSGGTYVVPDGTTMTMKKMLHAAGVVLRKSSTVSFASRLVRLSKEAK